MKEDLNFRRISAISQRIHCLNGYYKYSKLDRLPPKTIPLQIPHNLTFGVQHRHTVLPGDERGQACFFGFCFPIFLSLWQRCAPFFIQKPSMLPIEWRNSADEDLAEILDPFLSAPQQLGNYVLLCSSVFQKNLPQLRHATQAACFSRFDSSKAFIFAMT